MQYTVVSGDHKDLEGKPDLEPGVMWVKRTTAETQCKLCDYDEDGEPQEFNCPTDYGLSDVGHGMTVFLRQTSLVDCSCQYPRAFGGLPCRHMIHTYIVSGQTTYNTTIIAQKWLAMDAAEELRMSLQLGNTPAPAPPARASSGESSSLNRRDRFRLLLNHTRDVATLACEDPATFAQSDALFKELTRRLRRGLSIDGAWGSAAEPANKQATQQQAHGTFQASEVPAAEDLKDWTASLGVSRRAVQSLPPRFDDETMDLGELLVGYSILYKYNAKKSGGWYYAEVTDYDDENGMAKLEFEIDNKVEWHVIDRTRFTSGPAAPIRSWALVEVRPLHDVPSDMPILPPGGASRGRPASTRIGAPPGMPTAKRASKARAGSKPNHDGSPMKAARKSRG